MSNHETNTRMDRVSLLCKFRLDSVAILWKLDGEYDDFLCEKWNHLSIDTVSLVFKLPNHDRCLLRNHDEFIAMLQLVSAFKLKVVVIKVSMFWHDLHDEDTVSDNSFRIHMDEDDISDEPISDRLLLSSALAYTINDVGQGVNDFKDALRKYSVKSGFEFHFQRNNSRMISAYCTKKFTEHCK